MAATTPSHVTGLLLACGFALAGAHAEVAARHFCFESGAGGEGVRVVAADEAYAPERGCGFEPGETVHAVPGGVAAATGFHFTADAAEGNWRVRVKLLGPPGGATVAVKAELRRLMAGPVHLAAGAQLEREFVVNVRSVRITPRDGVAAGRVNLKAPRESIKEAWAWDDRLTLEIDGAILSAVDLEPARVPTVFLIGDSTVCDQSAEPYTSWGQMLPRLFKPDIAVANHAESGETYRDSIGRRRLDKIISVMQPGDWLLMQFGHNDQKQIAAGTGGPFTTYEQEMKAHIDAVRRVGGRPVVISPMERRQIDAAGRFTPTLADYAAASREVAAAEGVPFIDLNTMSLRFYAALGPGASAQAFAAPGGKVDNTHHDNYGAYELAKCVAQGLREKVPELAAHLAEDFTGFDPAQPDPPATFAVPPSPNFTNQRPLGD
ncbi:MAG TPA: rhamnogalacturonan acetylesterase [Lacunisphaera sp.]|nr:rhamnogalacturonan acetylesterase [Lacunisphaera sp.]